MDDPLLSSLCSICRINVPKYTCPRCTVQTCSLPCSRRHKLWSSCSGIRDPTVYKPKSQLATPSGVDHDYNFLHSIEHRIERSEKRIVDDRGLIEKEELAAARKNEDPDAWRVKMRKRKRQNPGQEPIERALKVMRTTVELAPKGMKRSVENGTSWAKRQKAIYWQVEWIREGNAGRSLSKVMGNKPIAEAYLELLDEERKNALSDAERKLEKKQRERKAKETRERLAREADSDKGLDLPRLPILQDPQTGAWSSMSSTTLDKSDSMTESKPSSTPYHFYLLRPKTPSSVSKVVTPLDPKKPLEKLLRRRLILEFPTLYILKTEPSYLPDEFMLEKDFLSATKQPPWQDSDTEMHDTKEENSSEEDANVSETSSSGSDSGEEIEEGEVTQKSDIFK